MSLFSALLRLDRAATARRGGLGLLVESGFRPFFLLAGVYACAPLVAWLLLYSRGAPFMSGWPAMAWHGHEMVFGFAGAAIAGFLLTAVPKWTGTAPVSRRVLGALIVTWLLGRAGMWAAAYIPAAVTAIADVGFFALLALVIGRAIYGTRNRRNFAFPALLMLLGALNALAHWDPGGAIGRAGTFAGIGVFLLAILIVGGRIVPAFTWSALEREGVEVRRRPRRGLRVATLVVAAPALLADFVFDLGPLAGALELGAGALVLASMTAWYGHRTLRRPILWVLHLGWAWLGVAFLLRGASAFGVVPPSVGLHAFTAGAIGTMILGVMSRAALGHTGRPLRFHPATAAACGLVSLGAALRVFGPLVLPSSASTTVIVGGALFALGYLVYVVVYLPVLTRPRVDGAPG